MKSTLRSKKKENGDAQAASPPSDAAVELLQKQFAALAERLASAEQERAQLQAALSSQAGALAGISHKVAQYEKQIVDSLGMLSGSLSQRDDALHQLIYDLHASQAVGQLSGEAARKRIEYEQLLRQIRDIVRTKLPRDATVAVVSKGDDSFLRLFGRKACHFPQNASGAYTGFHPADSMTAIAQVEWLRANGVTHFLLPAVFHWWLETYRAFHKHLQTRYRCVSDKTDICVIYALNEPAVSGADVALSRFDDLLLEFRYHFHRDPCVVDWNTGLDLAGRYASLKVLTPPFVVPPLGGIPDENRLKAELQTHLPLPYMDHTIDVVVVPAEIPAMIDEARRVAESCLLVVGDSKKIGADRLEVSWRHAAFPAPRDTFSIIVPVHNQIEITEACLTTLSETLPASFDTEIIVVNDASTDANARRLDELAARDPRIRVLHNDANTGLARGFLASANRAAAEAHGDLLIFLNNDTILLPGWFGALVQTFRDHPDAGVVGGRLLFPDGRLQEAGGMVFSDGAAGHFGRDDYNIADEAYMELRAADYCSGALLATRKRLFQQLGGFDPQYGFGYYEDTDYCFRVRRLGYRVYYQPQSTIVHIEGASARSDPKLGIKRYQVINQAIFAERWKDELARQPARPDYGDKAAWKAAAFHRCSKEGGRM